MFSLKNLITPVRAMPISRLACWICIRFIKIGTVKSNELVDILLIISFTHIAYLKNKTRYMGEAH